MPVLVLAAIQAPVLGRLGEIALTGIDLQGQWAADATRPSWSDSRHAQRSSAVSPPTAALVTPRQRHPTRSCRRRSELRWRTPGTPYPPIPAAPRGHHRPNEAQDSAGADPATRRDPTPAGRGSAARRVPVATAGQRPVRARTTGSACNPPTQAFPLLTDAPKDTCQDHPNRSRHRCTRSPEHLVPQNGRSPVFLQFDALTVHTVQWK
jgi:hypothetical protein